MSNRAAMVVIVVLLIIVVLVLVDDGRGDTQAVGRINVTATLVYSQYRYVRPPGRQSDAVEQSWEISDRYGHRIGRMLSLCRWLRPQARFCQNEIQMPQGKVVAAGSSLTPFDGSYAVTGGTGRYSEARGVMLFSAIGIRKTILLVTIA